MQNNVTNTHVFTVKTEHVLSFFYFTLFKKDFKKSKSKVFVKTSLILSFQFAFLNLMLFLRCISVNLQSSSAFT